MPSPTHKLLKKDTFGEIRLELGEHSARIVRDTRSAPRWARWLARRLLAREANALAALSGLRGVPDLESADRDTLVRSYLRGSPLYAARPRNVRFYKEAAALLRRMHRAGVVHNDLAKEPNVLVTDRGEPAYIDFQLAWYAPRRGRLFRVLAREDLRHLLKHKRTYCPERLTARERAILATPSLPSRLWARSVKPVYLFVTRRLLNWSDREGAADRTSLQPGGQRRGP